MVINSSPRIKRISKQGTRRELQYRKATSTITSDTPGQDTANSSSVNYDSDIDLLSLPSFSSPPPLTPNFTSSQNASENMEVDRQNILTHLENYILALQNENEKLKDALKSKNTEAVLCQQKLLHTKFRLKFWQNVSNTNSKLLRH